MSGVMRSWLHDYYWQDKFLPTIKAIIKFNAMHLIEIENASIDEDTKEATDIIVNVSGGKIAVRIRETDYRDLTLRCWRASGRTTELQKIREGFCRWYLYIWTSKGRVQDWILVDLDKLRQTGLLVNPLIQSNRDGITAFAYIPITALKQAGCIVSRWLDS